MVNVFSNINLKHLRFTQLIMTHRQTHKDKIVKVTYQTSEVTFSEAHLT